MTNRTKISEKSSQSTERFKKIIQDSIEVTWRQGDLEALPKFWKENCVNHAAREGERHGLASLRTYHEQFGVFFATFSDIKIDIEQQIAEEDTVVTYIKTAVKHTADFMGIPASGKLATLASMRIDRIENGKIVEHWSVADLAGLQYQLRL